MWFQFGLSVAQELFHARIQKRALRDIAVNLSRIKIEHCVAALLTDLLHRLLSHLVCLLPGLVHEPLKLILNLV